MKFGCKLVDYFNFDELLHKQERRFFMKIVGNIIEIINNRTVVIDCGLNSITTGQHIFIVDKIIDIKDLNGNIIGNYPLYKDELMVTEVFENFSICETFKVKKSNNSFQAALNPLSPATKEFPVSLNVDEEDNLDIRPSKTPIKKGDSVSISTK